MVDAVLRLPALARNLADPQFLGRAIFGLGVCAWRKARLAAAEAYFHEAQATAADLEYSVGADWGLGCVAFSRGDLAAAQDRFSQALETLDPTRHTYIAQSLNGLGMAAFERGDYSESADFLRRARRLASRSGGLFAEMAALLGQLRATLRIAVEGPATSQQFRLPTALLAR